MKTIQKALFGLAFIITFGIAGTQNVAANGDYVCSSYTTACNCTWDTEWTIEDGKAVKYCRGTTEQIIRIGNTRVGCPANELRGTGARDWTNGTKRAGGFRYGFTKPSEKSCVLKKYDTEAPTLSVSKTLVMGEVNVDAYKKTITTDFYEGTGCDLETIREIISSGENQKDCKVKNTDVDTQTYEKSGNSCIESYYFHTETKKTVKTECETTTIPKTTGVAYAAKVTETEDPDEVLYRVEGEEGSFSYVDTAIEGAIAKNFGSSGVDSIPAPKRLSLGEDTNITVCDKGGNCTTCNTANETCTVTSGTSEGSVGSQSTDTASKDITPPLAEIQFAKKGTDEFKANLGCINTDVKVQIVCTGDEKGPSDPAQPSGCRTGSESKDYIKDITTKEPIYFSTDQFITKAIGIADRAGNLTNLDVNIDGIDKSAPVITNLSGLYEGMSRSAGQEAKFSFTATDERDSGDNKICGNVLNYEAIFKLNGTPVEVLVKDEATGNYIKVDKITGTLNGTRVNDNNGDEKYNEFKSPEIFYKTIKKGNYNVEFSVIDDGGNKTTNEYKMTGYSGNVDESKTVVTLVGNSTASSCANNVDYFEYKVVLQDEFGNAINGKEIKDIQQIETNINNTIRIDITNFFSESAVEESGYQGVGSNSNGEVTFKIKSLAPGNFEQTFNIEVPVWGQDYVNSGYKKVQFKLPGIKTFTKPYSGELNIVDTASGNLSKDLRLGTTQRLNLSLNNECFNNGIAEPTNIKASDFASRLSVIEPGFTIESKEVDDKNADIRLDFVGTGTIQETGIIARPYLTYKLGGKTIKYALGSSVDPNDNDIQLGGTGFFGVKVIGTMQGDGKQIVTGQDGNYTDFSLVDLRTQIKKNAYELIRGLPINRTETIGATEYKYGLSETTKVKYVEGDYEISGNIPNYIETLIVKNGNLKITGNLNSSEKKFGIIVLNEDLSDKSKGNIYITPNPDTINAVMYADGGVISSDNLGNPYEEDSADRTNALQKQLIITGSLFTRNTIGGAILGGIGTQYKLPGGADTNNFNEAMKYDLNYLRRGVEGCNITGSSSCTDAGEHDSPLVIIYNSQTQVNPPVGFSK